MIDIYFDGLNLKKVEELDEAYKIVFSNDKDESLSLVLNEANFISLYYALKNRCEIKRFIPVRNEVVKK